MGNTSDKTSDTAPGTTSGNAADAPRGTTLEQRKARDEAFGVAPTDDPALQRADRILRGLGFCGHYMRFHDGGRSGRGPILCLLAKRGGQMPQQELGMLLELKPGSLSEILSKLEASGLIERTRDEHDRRQLFCRLTEAGAAEAAREHESRRAFREAAFTCLDADEQEALAVMLEKIRTRWEELA